MRDLVRRAVLDRFLRSGFGAALVALVAPNAPVRSQGPDPIAGFDHVAVPMRDTESMVRFYRSLGFRVSEGERICAVHFGDHKINFHRRELWQSREFTLRAPSAQPPCGDFCFVWRDSEDALVSALERAGAHVIAGPVERLGGRDGGSARGTSRYVRDPDGNLLEFIVY